MKTRAGAAARGSSSCGLSFPDLDEMRDLAQHPAQRGRVLVGDALPGPLEAERLERSLGGLLFPDRALVLAGLETGHETATASSAARRVRPSMPRAAPAPSPAPACPGASARP